MCKELHLISELEKCDYIRNHSGCLDTDSIIDYVHVTFCTFEHARFMAYIFGILWIFILFIMLGNLAEKFFCPILDVIAVCLRLSENVAGVTFVAFGTASADIFSSVVGANQSRPSLVYGALFGSGIFITTVIAGVVMIMPPVFNIMERPFLRDVIMYLIAVYMAYFSFYHGVITITLTIFFMIVYTSYLVLVIVSHHFYRSYASRTETPIRTPICPIPERESLHTSILNSAFVGGLYCHQDETEDSNEVTPFFRRPSAYDRPPLSLVSPVLCPSSSVGSRTVFVHEANTFWATVLPISLDELIKDSWPWKIYYIVRAPLVLALNLTIPAVKRGNPNNNWCRSLNSLHCLSGSLFVYAVCRYSGLIENDVEGGSQVMVIIVVGLVIAWIVFGTSSNDNPPSYHSGFAFFGFIVCVSWIFVLATEIVTLLKAVGIIFNLGDAILGMTILAWGNSITDFVTIVAICARGGHSRMGLSACFGGPVLNLLLGIGIPFTLVTVRTGEPVYTTFERPEAIATVFLFASILSSLIIIWRLDFKTNPYYGLYLISLYLLFLVTIVLSECNLLPI